MSKKIKQPILNPGWAIYLRTSTDDVQDPVASQQRQRDNIQEKLINAFSLPIIGVYSDVESGRKDTRPNYQRMLKDARLGMFSHVAIDAIDRFGRSTIQLMTAFKELSELGLEVRVANQPTMRIAKDARQDKLLVGILSLMAEDETDRMGERISGGLKTRVRRGGNLGTAPEGYISTGLPIKDADNPGVYILCLQQDEYIAGVLRLAWDLLLTNRYTLKKICEELHARNLHLSDGRMFVYVDEDGRTKNRTSRLSSIFRNPFYAGWVVSKHVDSRTLRGRWDPIVTNEEFEAGLHILAKRFRKKSPKKKNQYLLQGLVYTQIEGNLRRLICSRSNIHRKSGGTPYYTLRNPNINILCRQVDNQIPKVLATIGVDPKHVSELKAIYIQEIEAKFSTASRNDAGLKKRLQNIIKQEKKAFQQYLNETVSEEVWKYTSDELRSLRYQIEQEIANQALKSHDIGANFDSAMVILTNISKLYAKLSLEDQQQFLRLLVEKLIVDTTGKIIAVEFLPPFGYIADCYMRAKKTRMIWDDITKTATSVGGGSEAQIVFACSTSIRSITLDGNYVEPYTSLDDEENTLNITSLIQFPQRFLVQQILHKYHMA